MITINGKSYPLWSQFVEGKAKWIGGTLEESSVHFAGGVVTTITDVTLTKNGDDSAYFTVHGKNFSDGFDVECGGLTSGAEGWITFKSIYCPSFRIKEKQQ
jgi:hypothetical protein